MIGKVKSSAAQSNNFKVIPKVFLTLAIVLARLILRFFVNFLHITAWIQLQSATTDEQLKNT